MLCLGKRYKNQICLQKHLWEHHDCWKYAKRLMLNKHQSVQIMEAAQSLVTILTGLPTSYHMNAINFAHGDCIATEDRDSDLEVFE